MNVSNLNACLKCGEGTRLTMRHAAELLTFWLGCPIRNCSAQFSMVDTSQF